MMREALRDAALLVLQSQMITTKKRPFALKLALDELRAALEIEPSPTTYLSPAPVVGTVFYAMRVADGHETSLPSGWTLAEPSPTLPLGTRLILASENLLEQFGTRTERGEKITAEWGEPTPQGWYEPIFTVHTDDVLEPSPTLDVGRLARALGTTSAGTHYDGETYSASVLRHMAEEIAAEYARLFANEPTQLAQAFEAVCDAMSADDTEEQA